MRDWILVFVIATSVCLPLQSEDCEPKRACNATRDCSANHDTRDCEPHWACPDCKWYQAGCHVARLGCESDKARYKSQCEVEKAAQNKIYEANKPLCEVQKATEKLDCERIKAQQRLACEAGLDGPFSCSPGEVLGMLNTRPQDGITDFDELSGAVTTPIKKAFGQISWRETACYARATVVPYRNSRRSTDDFCTLDVQILQIDIEGHAKPPGDRFIRLEILPDSKASATCRDRTLTPRDRINVGGMVKIDKHFPGHRWLEIHVQNDFAVVDENATVKGSNPSSSRTVARQYTVVKGDSLWLIAKRAYGEPAWPILFRANRKTIRNPNRILFDRTITIP